MLITAATAADVAEITAIYGFHVETGVGTYELVPPAEAEMIARFARVLSSGGVWLVARPQAGGALLGYAYAAQFRDRAAYRFAAEDSIYIADGARGRGVGKALLTALIAAAEAAGFRQLIAVIGGPEPASIALHAALGFDHAGLMRGTGRKFGRWLDTVTMQRALGAGDGEAPPFEPL